MKKEEEMDFWEWVEDYHAHNTVPLQFMIAPSGSNQHMVTVGSPASCLKLSKTEYNKLINNIHKEVKNEKAKDQRNNRPK